MIKFNIEELIPQREPFLMVGNLIEAKEKEFTTSFFINSANLLCENGFFQEEGLIENMAQSAAAAAGYSFKINNNEIKLGFIGALKNVKINKLPPEGTIIKTKVKIIQKVLNVDLISAEVFSETNEQIASLEMKIFIAD